MKPALILLSRLRRALHYRLAAPRLCISVSRSAAMAVSTLLALLPAGAAPPNILLIIADDMGYSDLGCYGGEIETPHLDALADKGLRFTNYYVNNMCWPTRASLMTSLYPKTALPKNGSAEGGLHPEATTLPEALRKAGYRTLMSGKWHLSESRKLDGPGAPHHRGFDRYYGIISGAASFYAPCTLTRDGVDASADFDDPDYFFTDAIDKEAIQMLKDTDGDKPFFAYVAYTAAHWPLHAFPKDIAAYKGKFSKGYDQLRIERHQRMIEMGLVDPSWKLSPRHPDVPAWEDIEHQQWQERRMEVYAAQVTHMDRSIGRIIDHLKETGEFENTLVLYQHDNGACHVEYGKDRKGLFLPEKTRDGRPMKPGNIPGLMPGPEETYASYGYGWANLGNTPFRLFKQHDHEGGTRSPLIAHWPAGIDHDHQGGLAHELCHAIDMMPTLLELAGAEPPSQPTLPLEGVSFASSISPEIEPAPKPHDAIYWAHAKGAAVRQGDWKLVRDGKGPWELYDLYEDGTELNDLAKEMPERVAALEKLHAAWAKRTNLSPAKAKQNKKKGKK